MDGLMDGAEIADIALAIKPCLSESLDPEEVVGKLLDNGWIDCNEEELRTTRKSMVVFTSKLRKISDELRSLLKLL